MARDSAVDITTNMCHDRLRWKAIYLTGLLLKFVPPGEREHHSERLRERVQMLVRSGGLSLVSDYGCCLEPLAADPLLLETPTEQCGSMSPVYAAFRTWVKGFPLFPLIGSVSVVTKDKTARSG